MQGILIDPFTKTIEGVVFDGSLDGIYALIECDTIDAGYPFRPLLEVVYVGDDSALRDPPLPYFVVPGYRWPLFGRGLVLGHDRAGNECSTRLSVAELRRTIRFYP